MNAKHILSLLLLAACATMQAQQITFSRLTSSAEQGGLSASVEVDWPTAGPEAVVDSLRGYISENLKSWLDNDERTATSYSGNMADGQAMIDYYNKTAMRYLQADADEDMEMATNDITIYNVGQNDNLVTLECCINSQMGGGISLPLQWGQAFSIATGGKLTPVISEGFTSLMQPVLQKGAATFLEQPWSEAKEELTIDDDVIPLPEHPYYVPGGVRFVYDAMNQLGPNNLGMITFDVADADLPSQVVKSTAAAPMADNTIESDIVEITPEFTARVQGYDYLGDFSEGMAVVRKGEKSGFINSKGELVVTCQYDAATPFSDGIAAVSKNHVYGYIDKEGRQVLPFKYFPYNDDDYDDAINPSSCHEGLVANVQDGEWVYINKQGQTVISNTYDAVSVGRFSEGLAFLLLNIDDNRFVVIDKTGKQVFSGNCNGEFFYGATSDGLPYFHDGTIYVASMPEAGNYGNDGEMVEYYIIYDKQGNKVGETRTAPQTKGYERFEQDKKWGVKDQYGRVCIPAKYDFIDFPNEDGKLAASGVVVAEMFDTQNHKAYYGYADMKGHDTFSASTLALSRQSKQASRQAEQRAGQPSTAQPSSITAFNTMRDLGNYLKTPKKYSGSGPMFSGTIELRRTDEGIDMYVNGCYLSALGLNSENEKCLYGDYARFYVRDNGGSKTLYPVVIHLPDNQHPYGYIYFEPIKTSVDRRVLDAYNIPITDIPNPDGWLWVEPTVQGGRGTFILHTDAKTEPRPIIYRITQ